MSTIQLNHDNYHVMHSHLVEDGYVFLAWPKNLPLAYLESMREIVNFQIDTFIRSARRESEKEEAARLEVESWKVVASQGAPHDR